MAPVLLQTTRAIALRTFKHGDRSVVLKAYTEAFGLRSYMARTGKQGSVQPMHLQPLARLELVVTENRERELHAVREARLLKPYTGIPADPRRGMVLLFTQEVLYRTLRESAPDPALFAFAMELLEAIDTGGSLGRLPLDLMAGLARHLGFLPEPPRPGQDRFDLRDGCFFHGPSPHAFCLGPEASSTFARLLAPGPHRFTPAERKALLETLLAYFRFHVEGFGELRSPEILHELLL